MNHLHQIMLVLFGLILRCTENMANNDIKLVDYDEAARVFFPPTK